MRYITDAEAAAALTMQDAIDALKAGFATWNDAGTANGPRQRIAAPGLALNTMSAIYTSGNVFGTRAYFPHGENIGGHTFIYGEDRSLLCAVETDTIGRIRTGAISALATDVLTPPDASHLAIIGSGVQAYNQVAAIAAIRPLTKVTVFSPTEARRYAFRQRIETDFGVAATASNDAEACVSGAQIVVTATRSSTPVLQRHWLAPGVHVNAIGANALSRRELDDETVLAADLCVADDRAQARMEAAEYAGPVADGHMAWDDVLELGTLVSQPADYGPRNLTVFKSLGIALGDIILAALVFDRAGA